MLARTTGRRFSLHGLDSRQGIADPARLERMAERIFDATDWDDLLATS
jgi:hypothetical protein